MEVPVTGKLVQHRRKRKKLAFEVVMQLRITRFTVLIVFPSDVAEHQNDAIICRQRIALRNK